MMQNTEKQQITTEERELVNVCLKKITEIIKMIPEQLAIQGLFPSLFQLVLMLKRIELKRESNTWDINTWQNHP